MTRLTTAKLQHKRRFYCEHLYDMEDRMCGKFAAWDNKCSFCPGRFCESHVYPMLGCHKKVRDDPEKNLMYCWSCYEVTDGKISPHG